MTEKKERKAEAGAVIEIVAKGRKEVFGKATVEGTLGAAKGKIPQKKQKK